MFLLPAFSHTYAELLYFMCNAKIQPQPTETLTVCSIREVCITLNNFGVLIINQSHPIFLRVILLAGGNSGAVWGDEPGCKIQERLHLCFLGAIGIMLARKVDRNPRLSCSHLPRHWFPSTHLFRKEKHYLLWKKYTEIMVEILHSLQGWHYALI